jgi:hypothetical protein
MFYVNYIYIIIMLSTIVCETCGLYNVIYYVKKYSTKNSYVTILGMEH